MWSSFNIISNKCSVSLVNLKDFMRWDHGFKKKRHFPKLNFTVSTVNFEKKKLNTKYLIKWFSVKWEFKGRIKFA